MKHLDQEAARTRKVMSANFLKKLFLFFGWGVVLTGTLSIAKWPGDWGHSICGPWGCGPTLQALTACHLSWLAIALPLSFLGVRHLRQRVHVLLGRTILVVSAAGLLAFTCYEWRTWWSGASDWQRPYFWNRVGFSIITCVELPLLQLSVMGGLLACPWGREEDAVGSQTANPTHATTAPDSV